MRVAPPQGVHVTYRQEYRRCGKALCTRCKDKASHGPYWYGFARINGKLRSFYIGKKRPEGEEIAMEVKKR